jgi:hypothetical protein
MIDLSTLKKAPLHLIPWIDSVYLYSWQERDPTKSEFTAIGIEGKYGRSLFYLVFDNKDSLISSTKIAGTDDDGDSWSTFGTTFFSKDSFYMTTNGTTLHAIEKNGQVTVILTSDINQHFFIPFFLQTIILNVILPTINDSAKGSDFLHHIIYPNQPLTLPPISFFEQLKKSLYFSKHHSECIFQIVFDWVI